MTHPPCNERPDLLLLGWRNRAIDACDRLALAPTVVYSTASADDPAEVGFTVPPGAVDPARARRSLLVDSYYDVGDVLMALERARIDLRRFRAVYTSEEQAVVLSAVLAASAGLPGPSIRAAVASRDKGVQKRLFKEADLPTADYAFVDDLHLDEALRAPLYPAVLKPVAGAGSIATIRVDDAKGLRDAVGLIRRRYPALRNFLIEEYIVGDELQVDGFVADGVVKFVSVAEYGRPLIESRGGMVATLLDPDRQRDIHEQVRTVSQRVVDALGICDGVFHLELFKTADELVVGEYAARPGGGFTVFAVEAKHGIHLDEVGVGLASGIAPPSIPASTTRAVAYIELPMSPGRLIAAPSRDEVLQQPGVVEAVMRRPGYVMPNVPLASLYRVGDAVVVGETDAQLRDRLDALRQYIAGTCEIHAL